MTSQIMDLHAAHPSGAPVIVSTVEPTAPEASASRAHAYTAAPEGAPAVGPLVLDAQKRLGRVAGRALLIQNLGLAVGAGAALAACRPLLFPLSDTAPLWWGFARAAGLVAAGSLAFAVGLVLAGRRMKPSALGAARAVDDAAGLAEVVASGFAFERDKRDEPVVLLARRKAADAAVRFDVAAAFPLPSLRPSRRSLGRIGRLSLIVAVALAVGAYDRVLLGALLSPPTDDETEAAAELEAAAATMASHLAPQASKDAAESRSQVERDKSDEKTPSMSDKLSAKAREAAHAARRGDRQGALAKLDELRAGGKQRSSRAQSLASTLRQITDALSKPKGGEGSSGSSRAIDPTQKAADALRLLAKKTRSSESGGGGPNEESREHMLERLEHAADEARKAAGEGDKQGAAERAASEAARAMSQAREALSRGDREAASRLLEEAAQHTEAMERARAEAAAEAAAIMEMLEKSGLLEEAIQLALLGQDGKGQGQGDGQDGDGGKGKGAQGGKDGKDGNGGQGQGQGQGQGGLKAALAARLAALGIMDSKGNGGVDRGGGSSSQRRAKPREAMQVNGSIQAPSQVTEGERAIQAIRGLGKGSDPPASYREVFPSYDAAVEEGLKDERIPAGRRTAVRRYFQSIRPE